MTDKLAISQLEMKWAPFIKLMPLDVLASKVLRVLPFVDDVATGVVPSIHLLPDGPAINALFLFTARTVTQIYLGGDVDLWDTRYRYRIDILRWRFQDVEGSSSAGPVTYKQVEVETYRGVQRAFTLSFVGVEADRDVWVAQAREMVPANVVLMV